MSEDNKIIHETICWFCNRIFFYEGDRFRDVICPHCNIENSIYDPGQFIPLDLEEGEENA